MFLKKIHLSIYSLWGGVLTPHIEIRGQLMGVGSLYSVGHGNQTQVVRLGLGAFIHRVILLDFFPLNLIYLFVCLCCVPACLLACMYVRAQLTLVRFSLPIWIPEIMASTFPTEPSLIPYLDVLTELEVIHFRSVINIITWVTFILPVCFPVLDTSI